MASRSESKKRGCDNLENSVTTKAASSGSKFWNGEYDMDQDVDPD